MIDYKAIDKAIKDMVTGIDTIDNDTVISTTHHKREYKVRLIKETVKSINYFSKLS